MLWRITDKLASIQGLFQTVLGEFDTLIAVDQRREKIKRILKEVYGYKDINKLFPEQMDHEKVDRFFKTVFTYHDQPQDQEVGGLFKK